MSALAGIVALDHANLDRQVQAGLWRALASPRARRGVAHRLQDAIVVQRGSPGHTHPLTTLDGRILFAAIARIDNRAELGRVLGLASEELARTPDAMLVRRMYESGGDAGLARCLGAFAFASWDADAGRLTLGRDCLGHRPMFFHRGPRSVAFATTLGAMLALPGVPRELDELVLANYMVFNNIERRGTFYRGIERVPSRTLVTIDRDAIRHREYWAPDLD